MTVVDHPSNDPIGTVRSVDGHVFVKLAEPASEPWHIVWCEGEQNMSGWQSDEDMVGAQKWHGYLPVRECGVEGQHYVGWERYSAARTELDELKRRDERTRVWARRAAALLPVDIAAEHPELMDGILVALKRIKDAAQPPTSEASPQ